MRHLKTIQVGTIARTRDTVFLTPTLSEWIRDSFKFDLFSENTEWT